MDGTTQSRDASPIALTGVAACLAAHLPTVICRCAEGHYSLMLFVMMNPHMVPQPLERSIWTCGLSALCRAKSRGRPTAEAARDTFQVLQKTPPVLTNNKLRFFGGLSDSLCDFLGALCISFFR